MLTEFEQNVAAFAQAEGLFDSANRILLAVSGGADSIALLNVLRMLKAEGLLDAKLICSHINHQLRGAEADSDQDFVTTQVENLSIPVITKRIDVRAYAHKNKLSIETAGRRLRIESLLEIAKANNCDIVATGHQKNDNAETIVYRLLRGTGFRGLGGIWPIKTFNHTFRFIRPLLCVTREEVIEYLQLRNLKWREDLTNVECKYRRNFIRHLLLPSLQKDCHASVIEQLSQLAESSRKFYQLICQRCDQAWQEVADRNAGSIQLHLRSLASASKPIQQELVRRAIIGVGGGERDITQNHYERIMHLIKDCAYDKKTELPSRITVQKKLDKLIFISSNAHKPLKVKTQKNIEIKIPGQTKFGHLLITAAILKVQEKKHNCFKRGKNNSIERFDLDRIKLPLAVRFRRAGDRFWPLGLKAEKKVGKFLTTAKVSQQVREKTVIVADSEKIIWVCPVRISEKAKVMIQTSRILELQVTHIP